MSDEKDDAQRFAVPQSGSTRVDDATALRMFRGFQYWESGGLDDFFARVRRPKWHWYCAAVSVIGFDD